MAVTIRIEKTTGLAIATCSGMLRLNDALEGATALWRTRAWPGRSAVWDFRAAEFDVSESDVREIARFVLENQPESAPSKVAFVTERDVDFGMARMFEVYREDSRTDFRVFRDYDEAIRWARSLAPRTRSRKHGRD